jgi:hypothetical protein
MNEDEVDIDPEDPDNIPVFVEGDKRKFHSTNPRDVLEHNRALAEFEARERERERIRNQNANALLERKRFGVTRKVCSPDCTCSYCGGVHYGVDYGKPMKPGINVPKQWWAFNSWWVWRRDMPSWIVVYYCFTPLSFLRTPQLWWRKNVTRTL